MIGGGDAPGDASELESLRAEHANVAQLVLVLESHLGLMSTGDGCDTRLVLDVVDYLIDYAGRLHRSREALQLEGAELRNQLELALCDEPLDRRDVVCLGFEYCTELRRSMALAETALDEASATTEPRPLERASRADHAERRDRATFEELTQRVGCGCEHALPA